MNEALTPAAWLFGNLAERVLEANANGLWEKLRDRQARRDLAEACGRAIEAAAETVSGFDLHVRSQCFLDGVVVPLLRGILESDLGSTDACAGRYVDMFVLRYVQADDADPILRRFFQIGRPTLLHFFESFLDRLKAELYASPHWKELQHYSTTESIAAGVARIEALFEAQSASARASRVDIDQALRDAVTASADMRAWPSDIHGVRLETPVLGDLVSRIVAEPTGRTLLIGDAGTGKSAMLARLSEILEAKGITVFAVKADLLPASVRTIEDLAAALGIRDGIEDRIAALAARRPVALLLDQLDAVSEVMDRRSGRMRILLQLVYRLGMRQRGSDRPLRVHVLVTSRPFEAAHDARFDQLAAHTIRLDLLDEAQVQDMLERFRFSAGQVSAPMRQTLRRPFALKLFVDILARGGDGRALTPADLLDAWMATADLGDPTERRAAGVFLNALATEMVETETLWRPADAFALAHHEALHRAEAAGLVVRSEGSIGFSHQSWLDDFQARSFRTGSDLAEFTWDRQDTLFIRASVLRALERLRARDVRAYETALRSLLGNVRTRRHILHLVVDIVATAQGPLSFEIGWVDHWLRSDLPLALRALRQLAPRWNMWRDGLRHELPTIMAVPDLQWSAVRLLAQEVRFDADHVSRLIDRHWSDANKDRLVFAIMEQCEFTGLDAIRRTAAIFARTAIEDHQISQVLRSMGRVGRHDDAAAIVSHWLESQPTNHSDQPRVYELEKFAEQNPLAAATHLLPWFLRLAGRHVGDEHAIIVQYPRSYSLPQSFDAEVDSGSPLAALEKAITVLGQTEPEALWTLLEPITRVDIDQVQELVATGLAAAGGALADRSLQYLLADERRLHISHIITEVGEGVIGSVDGWHSQELVRAVAPHLDARKIAELRDAIETWSYYTDAALAGRDAEWMRATLDQHRFPLLAALPFGALSEARAAVVEAWRLRERPAPIRRKVVMASWVGPPMTHGEMTAATDDEILAALDEYHDGSIMHGPSRPISRSGGVRELARAMGAFARANPGRVATLAAKLRPGRHERAAGEMIRELARAEEVDTALLRRLILDMNLRGFSSPEWRDDAAHVLQDVARVTVGLDDGVVALLERWIETDPDSISAQVAARLQFEERNVRARTQENERMPLLFGAGGGIDILPNGNFTILSAIAMAFLCRQTPDCEAWTAALTRHVERPEDPAIWTSILAWRGDYLSWASEDCVTLLLSRLHERFPDAWCDVRLTRFLWQLRKRIPTNVLVSTMISWTAGNEMQRQAAAEIITAAHLVAPDEARYRLLFDRLHRTDRSVVAGVLFSAGAAWQERDPVLRPAAHAILMSALPDAEGDAAGALSRVLDERSAMIPDHMTRELLAALAENKVVLEVSLKRSLPVALQGLLLYPHFDDVVLRVIESVTELVTGSQMLRIGPTSEELVRVAIALQRSDEALRSRAMDVYERLLDAAVYGAEEAATAALGR